MLTVSLQNKSSVLAALLFVNSTILESIQIAVARAIYHGGNSCSRRYSFVFTYTVTGAPLFSVLISSREVIYTSLPTRVRKTRLNLEKDFYLLIINTVRIF